MAALPLDQLPTGSTSSICAVPPTVFPATAEEYVGEPFRSLVTLLTDTATEEDSGGGSGNNWRLAGVSGFVVVELTALVS